MLKKAAANLLGILGFWAIDFKVFCISPCGASPPRRRTIQFFSGTMREQPQQFLHSAAIT